MYSLLHLNSVIVCLFHIGQGMNGMVIPVNIYEIQVKYLKPLCSAVSLLLLSSVSVYRYMSANCLLQIVRGTG